MRIPFPAEEYRAAVELESESRTLAFADVPEMVCGVPVRAITLQDVIVLDGAKSPFMVGGMPTPEDIILFLWLQSTEFKPGSRPLRRFARKHRDLVYADACKAILELIDATFLDAPKGDGKEHLPYYAWPASLVDLFGSEYGWSESETLKCPIKRLFQYRKVIVQRKDPNAVLWNPSMQIRSAWLKAVNEN
jgi:hypothetical protein